MSILTGSEIIKQHKAGKIHISPFDEKQINPNSYNFRLGNTLAEYQLGPTDALDPKQTPKTRTYQINPKGHRLEPGTLYLGTTVEEMGSDLFVPLLDGRSTTGRLGISIHATAGFGDLGFKAQWTLEIWVIHPVFVYPGMEIGQVSFWTPQGDIDRLYQGRYAKQKGPTPYRV